MKAQLYFTTRQYYYSAFIAKNRSKIGEFYLQTFKTKWTLLIMMIKLIYKLCFTKYNKLMMHVCVIIFFICEIIKIYFVKMY